LKKKEPSKDRISVRVLDRNVLDTNNPVGRADLIRCDVLGTVYRALTTRDQGIYTVILLWARSVGMWYVL
jgi:hypothetical protein